MKRIAEQIKQSVTARQAAERYGFEANRSGFIKCPFHTGDSTASLKIFNDGGWHCFGCGKGGSAIDFVMELYGESMSDACRRLDADFRLNLLKETSFKDRRKMARERADRERERAEKEAEAEYSWDQYKALCSYRRWLSKQSECKAVLFDIAYMDRLLDKFLDPNTIITFDAAARVNALLSKHENRGDYDLHSGDY